VTVTPRTLRALLIAMSVVALAFFMSAYVFIYVLYNGVVSTESIIEAAYYAAQTVTTVGYGTWERPALGTVFEPHSILIMRAWSVFFMGLGSLAFAVFIGVVVSIFIPPDKG
jgi:hypothetical protein